MPRAPKSQKDPNAPKRPLSTFFLFSQDERPKIKKENPSLSVSDIAKVIGERWRAISDDKKRHYEERARQEKERYDREIAQYKQDKVIMGNEGDECDSLNLLTVASQTDVIAFLQTQAAKITGLNSNTSDDDDDDISICHSSLSRSTQISSKNLNNHKKSSLSHSCFASISNSSSQKQTISDDLTELKWLNTFKLKEYKDNKTNHNNNNNNNLYNHKLNYKRQNSCSPATVTFGDSDRHMYSSTINYTENDGHVMSKLSSRSLTNNNESVLRVNFKEKKNRPCIPVRLVDHSKTSLKRAYSYIDKNHCEQDELTWFIHRREHSHSSFTPMSPKILSNYKYNHSRSHHLGLNEHLFNQTNDYNSNRMDLNKRKIKRNSSKSLSLYNNHHYQTSFHNTTLLHRHNSLLDSIKISPPSTTMNIFNLCHCYSATTSTITIHSNSFVNNHKNSNHESYNQGRQISTSSLSSVLRSSIKRNQQQSQSILSL
ncbi:unnamed protein product, partial [Rotaria sp. Silwood1]